MVLHRKIEVEKGDKRRQMCADCSVKAEVKRRE